MTSPEVRERRCERVGHNSAVHADVMSTQCARVKTVPWHCEERINDVIGPQTYAWMSKKFWEGVGLVCCANDWAVWERICWLGVGGGVS